MENGFSEIISYLIKCAGSAYTWFDDIFTHIGTLGLNSPKVLVRAMLIVMLSTRFILYPFLKGRVVGGMGEEFGRGNRLRGTHYVYDNTDHFNPVSND